MGILGNRVELMKTIEYYRMEAERDKRLLSAVKLPQSIYSMNGISDRYYEAVAAIMFYEENGRLPKWAE